MKTDILMNGSTVKKPHLIKNGIRIQCNTENFVPMVVPYVFLMLVYLTFFFFFFFFFSERAVGASG